MKNVAVETESEPIELSRQPRAFVKWAGGKRQLVPEIRKVIPASWDPARDHYYEPFAGSGALFWELKPSRAHLNDLNAELVNCFEVVASSLEELVACLSRLEARYRVAPEETYYSSRNNFDSLEHTTVGRAARFIFLNKAGFNGLYRVNLKGGFNVPWGKNPKATICDVQNLEACSALLASARPVLSCGDFAQVGPILKGSLVYVDPPYAPVSKTSNFTAFTKEKFGFKEHERLAKWCSKIARRRAHVVVSQSANEEVLELYRKRGFEVFEVQATRRINSKASSRGKVGECLLVK